MSTPALLWRHVTISGKSTWLPGDPRGFRSRDHRIHSSGNYRHRPPEGEHQDLHEYMKVMSGQEVNFARELRPLIGRGILVALRERYANVLAIAVAKVHAHVLTELPNDLTIVRAIVGDAKRIASRAVKTQLPGAIWSAGGSYKPVFDDQHLEAVEGYILYDQGPTAWTWSAHDGSDDGQFARVRSGAALR